MMPKGNLDAQGNLADSRGRTYGFLASLYLHVPDAQFVDWLLGDKFSETITSLSSTPQLPDEMLSSIRLIEDFLKESKELSRDKVRENLAVDWTRLFRAVRPGYGPAPPYESVYEGGSQRTTDGGIELLLEITRVYDKAGVTVDTKSGRERPDYIGIELDFMRYLAEREAKCLASSDRLGVSKYSEAQKRFLQGHALRWIPRFCDTALAEARTEFFRGVLELTKTFLAMDSSNMN